eukprot:Gb_15006 [translate_table: standard]
MLSMFFFFFFFFFLFVGFLFFSLTIFHLLEFLFQKTAKETFGILHAQTINS